LLHHANSAERVDLVECWY